MGVRHMQGTPWHIEYLSTKRKTYVYSIRKPQNSIKRIYCTFAKVSGGSWRVCTCEDSPFCKQPCKKECQYFIKDEEEAAVNNEPGRNKGHDDWEGFEPEGNWRKTYIKANLITKGPHQISSKTKKKTKKKLEPVPDIPVQPTKNKPPKPKANTQKNKMIGMRVLHRQYGRGKITNVDSQKKIEVTFDQNVFYWTYTDLLKQGISIIK